MQPQNKTGDRDTETPMARNSPGYSSELYTREAQSTPLAYLHRLVSSLHMEKDSMEIMTHTIIMRKVKTAATVLPALLSVPEKRYVVTQSTINMQSRMTRATAI
jgi:hypothetical protein